MGVRVVCPWFMIVAKGRQHVVQKSMCIDPDGAGGPERPLCEVVNMKPWFQWRPHAVGGLRYERDLSRKLHIGVGPSQEKDVCCWQHGWRSDKELEVLVFALLGFGLSFIQNFIIMLPFLSCNGKVYFEPLHVGNM